jgi:hypothetical protein
VCEGEMQEGNCSKKKKGKRKRERERLDES